MPAYDATRFEPPAPLARVALRHPDTGATLVDVPMLVDCGADLTLIPQASVKGLGAMSEVGAGFELMGFDGTKSVAQAVHLELIFLGRAFNGKFLLIDQEWGILGRNILNHIPLLLDDPHLTWNEHKAV